MFDMVNMMESRNPMVRLAVFGRIKRVIMSMRERRITAIDRKVVRGLFIKNLKDFDEDFREKMRKKTLLQRIKDGSN